jgi:hypothetical protein
MVSSCTQVFNSIQLTDKPVTPKNLNFSIITFDCFELVHTHFDLLRREVLPSRVFNIRLGQT